MCHAFWVICQLCLSASGLASPSVLQAPVPSKPKNSGPAISKPQEGQFCLTILFPSLCHIYILLCLALYILLLSLTTFLHSPTAVMSSHINNFFNVLCFTRCTLSLKKSGTHSKVEHVLNLVRLDFWFGVIFV